MPARRRGGGASASGGAAGRPVVPQPFSGAPANNNGIGAGVARSINVSGVGEGDWLADPVNNQLAFKVKGVFLISATLTFAAQANETYEPSLGIGGATGKFERLWASRKLVERASTGNIAVDLAAIVYVDKADDDATEEIGVSILNDSLAGHSIINFGVSDMDVVPLAAAGPPGRNAPVLSDAQIGDKAFKNPPSDLSDAEKEAARTAIGAETGAGDGTDQTARDAAAAAGVAAMAASDAAGEASAAAATNAAAIALLQALVGDGSLIREEFAGLTGATTAEETVPGVTVVDNANVGYALRVGATTEFQLGNALRAARANTAIAVGGVNFYSNGDGHLLLTKDEAAQSAIAVWVVRDISAIRAAIAAVGGAGASITVEDQGSPLATAATVLNFMGAGVEVTGEGAEKTITIRGGGGGGLQQVGATWIATAQNNGNFRDTGIALPANPNDNAVYALATAFAAHGGTFPTISGAQIKALATVVAGASAGGMEIGGDPVSAETLFAAKLASGNLALRNDAGAWAAGNYAALFDLTAGDSSGTPSTPGSGSHDRLIGWSAAAVPTQTEINAAATEQDNTLTIPAESDNGYIFFAVPVSVGAPRAAYYDGNTHDILGGFTQRANADRGGTAYLVWSTNAAQSAAIMGTGSRTLTLSYAAR